MKYPKGPKGACDRLFSEIVRSIGLCEQCGRKPPAVQLQCAHIISRRYSSTRTSIRNAFCLCAADHRYFTDHPLEFAKFVQRSWASEFYNDEYVKSQNTAKVDWSEEQRYLRGLRDRLNGGVTRLMTLRLEGRIDSTTIL